MHKNQITAQLIERLKQLHKTKPKPQRWVHVYYRFDYKLTYELFFKSYEYTHIMEWYELAPQIRETRYRLKHINYNFIIYRESYKDLIDDLYARKWT